MVLIPNQRTPVHAVVSYFFIRASMLKFPTSLFPVRFTEYIFSNLKSRPCMLHIPSTLLEFIAVNLSLKRR